MHVGSPHLYCTATRRAIFQEEEPKRKRWRGRGRGGEKARETDKKNTHK
jgi:hypothetical protein